MTIKEIFETMDYGPAPEDAGEAMAWLDSHDRKFGHFIGGAYTRPGKGFDSRNPATTEVLARVTQGTRKDVDTAVAAARKTIVAQAIGTQIERD